MSDPFLYLLREEPSPQFTSSLRARLRQLQLEPEYEGLSLIPNPRKLLRVASILAGFLVVAACARAAFDSDLYTRAAAFVLPRLGSDPYSLVAVFPPNAEVSTVPVVVPLEEPIQGIEPIAALPTWIPPGFEMRDAGTVIYPGGYLSIAWADNRGGLLVLRAWDVTAFIPFSDSMVLAGVEIRVPPGSWEQVPLGEGAAILVRGLWRAEGTDQGRLDAAWDGTPLSLHWIRGTVHYALEAKGPLLTSADLIRVASSLP